MTERIRLPARRDSMSDRITWRTADGRVLSFHVTVGFLEVDGVARPMEVFARPTRKSGGRTGAMIYSYADEIGECLSLLMQHGYTLGDLADRFKDGGLALAIIKAIGTIGSRAP